MRPLLLLFSAIALVTPYPVLMWLVSGPSFGRLLAAALWLFGSQGVFASYRPLPCAILCGLIYIVLSRMAAPRATPART